jgi:hypothetical protein
MVNKELDGGVAALPVISDSLEEVEDPKVDHIEDQSTLKGVSNEPDAVSMLEFVHRNLLIEAKDIIRKSLMSSSKSRRSAKIHAESKDIYP